MRRPRVWWRTRSLRTRLAVLVAAAVAVAILALGTLTWVAVRGTLYHQLGTDVQTQAETIAARPDRWQEAATRGTVPEPDGDQDDDDRHHSHDVGPRWQILDASGAVLARSGTLPVTSASRAVAAGGADRADESVDVGDESYRMLTVRTRHGGAVQVAVSEEATTRTLTVLAILLVGACALGVAVAAVLGRLVARSGLRPVEELTEAVEDVTATMDLTRPIDVTGDDEIGRLGRSVNTMLDAIGTARAAQRTLVEDAGHELRTPLTSIRTNIELLLAVERQPERAHRLPPEERARLLRDLDAQVVELATLTSELVELAREETTREAIEPIDFADVVDAAVARVRMRAPGVTFATDLRPCPMRGRPAELERMVLNVLDNAAKWSPPDGVVTTTLRADGVLTVEDAGPGIDPADLPHVFDRFYRASAARSTPGSGLGLAIVAQTVAQHGGTVSAAARDGGGTVVAIRLPVSAPAEN